MKLRRGVKLTGLTLGLVLIVGLGLFAYRLPLVQFALERLITKSGARNAQLSVLELSPSRIVIADASGTIEQESFTAEYVLSRVEISFSPHLLALRKVATIELSGGQLKLKLHGKGDRQHTSSGIIPRDYPFQRLILSEFSVELNQGDVITQLSGIHGTIAADGFSLTGKSGDSNESVHLRGIRNARGDGMDVEGKLDRTGLALLLSRLNKEIAVTEGTLSFALHLPLANGPGILSSLVITATDLSGSVGGFTVKEAKVNASFPELAFRTEEFGEFSIERLSNVLEFSEIQGKFGLHETPRGEVELVLKETTGKTAGGLISIGEAEIPFGGQSFELLLELKEINVEQLLTYYPQTRLTMTGSVDGALPMKWQPAAGVSVAGGRIESVGGGRISLRSEGLMNDPTRVFQLLGNFQYESLAADVDYIPSGDLTLALRLFGANPEWEGGQPINLNVTLSQNLLDLVESIRLTVGAGDAIVERAYGK